MNRNEAETSLAALGAHDIEIVKAGVVHAVAATFGAARCGAADTTLEAAVVAVARQGVAAATPHGFRLMRQESAPEPGDDIALGGDVVLSRTNTPPQPRGPAPKAAADEQLAPAADDKAARDESDTRAEGDA